MVNTQTTPRCPNCGDEDDFRSFLLSNGIFVPDWYVLWALIENLIDWNCNVVMILYIIWFAFYFNFSSEDENSESANDNDQPSDISFRSRTPDDVLNGLSGEM